MGIDLVFIRPIDPCHTCVPLSMYWSHGRAKLEIAVVKGKQLHDKRDSEKQRDWQREKQQAMRAKNKYA